MPKILVVTTDGHVSAHDMPGDFLAFCRERIGCSLVDVMRLDGRVDMWFDDEMNYTQPEPNIVATAFRVASGLGHHMVMGPVVLASYNDEGGTEPLAADQMLSLLCVVNTFRELAVRISSASLN